MRKNGLHYSWPAWLSVTSLPAEAVILIEITAAVRESMCRYLERPIRQAA